MTVGDGLPPRLLGGGPSAFLEITVTDRVWLPLQGEGGERPKAPSAKGWQSPSYTGLDMDTVDPNCWIGLRTDNLVVIDCDSAEAAAEWLKIGTRTCTRKTPRGYHFIYEMTAGSPTGPSVGVFPGTDIRAGRLSQIVFYAPGYRDVEGELSTAQPFNPAWLPEARKVEVGSDDEWSEMPEGRGNNTMTAIAGAMRRQGMDMPTIYGCLKGINKLTMHSDPMPDDMVQQIAMSVCRYAPDPDIVAVAEDNEPEEVDLDNGEWLDARQLTLPPPPEWMWKPYLPKGRLVMLDGIEGIGKGMFCVWAALKVAAGVAFPHGKPHVPRPVVWFTAEDDPQEDILRRLLAAGYDQGRHEAINFHDPSKSRWTFPSEINKLRGICKAYQPGLVIIDPGRSYLRPEEGVEFSFNNEAALRPALEQLMRVAQEFGITIIFVHHWNKIQNGTTREKMGGSGAFLQVVRHRVSLAEEGGLKALSVEKSNITDKQHTVLTYEIAEVPELDTAKFVAGGPLMDFRNLDEWIEYTRKLNGEDVTIESLLDPDEVAKHYSQLPLGNAAPTVQNIADDFGITQDEAKSIRLGLKSMGVIGSNNKWQGPSAKNQMASDE